MATATLDPQLETRQANFWIQAAAVWHGVLAMAAVGGTVALWLGEGQQAAWLRIVLTVILIAFAVGSALAAYQVITRQHQGRLLSLGLNYLGLLFSIVASAHVLGIFTGLDALADTFGRGLPFLLLAFLGYLIVNYGRNPENSAAPIIAQIGRVIMIGAGIIFLWLIGLVTGLAALVSRIDSLTPILLVLGIALFAVMIRGMWQRPVANVFGTTISDTETINGYLFLSPNLLGFLIFFAGPLLLSLYFSFTNSDAFGNAEWIGLANYAEIFNLDIEPLASPDQLANEVLDVTTYDELTRFTIFGNSYVIGAEDKLFWLALGNTLRFVLFAVPLSVIPALFLANLLNSKIPGMKFFRAIYFLPSVAAVVGIALVWQWLFNATIGYINYGITLLTDLFNTIGIGVTDPQVRWLSEGRTALLAVIIMSAWQWIGFNTVLFLAGLQNIPGALYEAATVDGATPRQQFWRITLPLLAPTTFFVVTTTVIQAMQVFEQVFILIPGSPAGPNNSTLTMVVYLYQKGFQRFEQGYASAIAWVLFLLIFGATLFQFQRQRSAGTSYDA